MFLLPPQGRKRLNDIGHVFLHVGAEDCGRLTLFNTMLGILSHRRVGEE